MGFLKDNLMRLILVCAVIIAFFFIAQYLTMDEKFYNSMLEMRKQKKFSGIVVEKYIDTFEHSTPMLKLNNNNNDVPLENEFWDSIMVGDSVVKIRGQAEINVYRNDSTKIILNYNDYYKEVIERSKKKK